MRVLVVTLFLALIADAAVPRDQRIVGGTVTTINAYPEMVSLLSSRIVTVHRQECGGSILNNRAVLTAAHCTFGYAAATWRSRVGSTFANSGGIVHFTQNIINHPSYDRWTSDNDIAIIRTSTAIQFSNVVQPASIAGANYFLGDNQVVWAAGWGLTQFGGQPSEQLRHVQIWVVNQEICRARYAEVRAVITENMLCSGWLDVGGRDQCQMDSGGPLFHNRVVVGVSSFGIDCGHPRYPGVNTRVSRFASWIQINA